MADARPTIIRNGRLVDRASHKADPVDILVVGDTIAEIGKGLAAPADAKAIDAGNRLLHPGLVNAHTHGHSNFSKGMGDLWTLELLLAAAPYITGNRLLRTNISAPMSARSRCC